MAQPTFNQISFWGREDDGSESTATFKGAQGSDFSQQVDTNFRVRFLIDEQNSKAWSGVSFNLYYDLNGGGYNAVTNTSPVQYATSTNYTSGIDCVSRLTGGTGAFLTDNNGQVHSTATATNSGAINDYFEVEYCLTIDSVQVENGNTITLRVYDSVTAINSYVDEPIITVSEATVFQQTNTGSETSSGSVGKKTSKLISGISSFVGDISKKVWEFFSGSETPSGITSVSKFFARIFDGSMGSSGNILIKTIKALSAIFSSSGDVVKNIFKIFSGSETPSGIASVSKFFARLFSGSETSSGTVSFKFLKFISGIFNSSGNLNKKSFKLFGGDFNSSGILSAFRLGVLNFQSLSGSMGSSGNIVKKTSIILLGGINFSGDVIRKIFKQLSGQISSSGIVSTSRKIVLSLSGIFSSSGSISKKSKITISGLSNFDGSTKKKTIKSFSGLFDSIGSFLGNLVIDVLHGKAKLTILGRKNIKMGRKDIFDIGDAVRVRIEFKDEDGNLGDPTNVTFKYKVKKSGTPVVYVYGTDAEIVKEATGIYYCDILVAQSDPHYVSFIGQGSLDSVEEDVFFVNNSYFE